jgi:predicted ribosomally synthesized peptide with nif11-like leader
LLKESQPFTFYHATERRKQAVAFLKNVGSDHRLRDKISIANSDYELVKIAEEAGYRVSSEDIWLYQDRTFKRKAGIRGWYSN